MKATKLEIGVLRQEALLLRGRRKEEEVRRQKKYFYKYEMLPSLPRSDNLICLGGPDSQPAPQRVIANRSI
ncbi:MAG TPA: hypothetical protein VLA84_22750 [Microcoleus sp.]|nr:hypothetical protein [Microcoleus sp.]